MIKSLTLNNHLYFEKPVIVGKMEISDNIRQVKERIKLACERCGRQPEQIRLIAVTKTHTVETVKKALAAGITSIAENKVQEAEVKIPVLRGLYREFHFIGHLQSNKIKKLIALEPVLIHSLDSLSTASRLNEFLLSQDRMQEILVQVNTSGENSKSGIPPENAEDFLRKIDKLDNLRVTGLMTIGLLSAEEEPVRNCFRLLKNLFDQFARSEWKNIKMKKLSMGMTDDFEIAIEEGANLLRIGSAIFGPRLPVRRY